MSSLSNISKKDVDSNTYCTPRHITTSFQKCALLTKQKFASLLEVDPSYRAYWRKKQRHGIWS